MKTLSSVSVDNDAKNVIFDAVERQKNLTSLSGM